MFKTLAPQLIASALAALIGAVVGAVVGGLIARDIATENTRTQFVVGTYSSYVNEATRAFFLTRNGARADETNSADGNDHTKGIELRDKDKLRLNKATAVLMISASDKVLRCALAFQSDITSAKPDGESEYQDLLFTIREEALGETIEGLGPRKECKWTLM